MEFVSWLILFIISLIITRIAVKIDLKNDSWYIDDFNAFAIIIMVIIILVPVLNVIASIIALGIVLKEHGSSHDIDSEKIFKRLFLIRDRKEDEE